MIWPQFWQPAACNTVQDTVGQNINYTEQNMTSPTKSVRLAPDLLEAVELRRKALGYKDLTAYIIGLIRYDLLVQGEHTLTLPYSQLPADEQDKINAKLLDLTKKGKGERGQLLKNIIKRMNEGDDPASAVAA
jgi:hypothetical protein